HAPARSLPAAPLIDGADSVYPSFPFSYTREVTMSPSPSVEPAQSRSAPRVGRGRLSLPDPSGSNQLLRILLQLLERRHVAGATPNAFLKARENAASDS